jgi:hypothetical protein
MNQRIIPTADELKLLREKLSNIKDLHLFKNIEIYEGGEEEKFSGLKSDWGVEKDFKSQINNNLLLPEKEVELMNQRYYEIQRYIEANKEKIEKVEKYDQILKENEELKYEISQNQFLNSNMTFQDILKDYINMKSDYILMSEKIRQQEKTIYELEKQNKILKDLDSGNNINKNYYKIFTLSLLNDLPLVENKKFFSDLFSEDSNMKLLKFLSNHVSGLEFQNYSLVSKIEKLKELIVRNFNELIEYSEVISDIKNVLNQVYDSQSITNEFIIIRETLNNRSNFLAQQKESFILEKEKIKNFFSKEKNTDMILCKDKLIESKVMGRSSSSSNLNSSEIPSIPKDKLIQVLDEKIDRLESVKETLANYEEYMKIRNEGGVGETVQDLMNDNYVLKIKNFRLREILLKIVQNEGLNEENVVEEILSKKKDVLYSDDLLRMLQAQAIIIENNFTINY